MNMKKNTILIIAISLLIIAMPIKISSAQTASPSAELDSDLVKEKLKERLEKTLAENPIPKRTRWYGLFGTITAKTGEDTLSLTKSDSSTATIILTSDTELSFYKSGSPTKKIKMADIQQDWFAIAMGTEMSDNLTLTASRISFSPAQAAMPKRNIVYGKVTEIDDKTINLANGKVTTAKFPKKYTLVIKGVTKPKLEDINIDDKAIAIVEDLIEADTVTQNIKSIYVIPSKTNPKSEANQIKEASKSATPSASVKPGTSPKPTSKPTVKP